MGYWGWRPLVLGLFMSTWIVGCNIVTEQATSSTAPTPYPSVTLTIGRLASPRAAPTRVASTRVEEAVDPAAIPLVLGTPTCYELFANSQICLGLVSNPLNYAVESVVVEVQYAALSQLSVIEQAVIPPGGSAPYQSIFDARTGDESADVNLINADIGTDDRWVALETERVSAETFPDGRFVISAQVVNSGTTPAEVLRAVVTLLDDDGRVVGYRVLTFDEGALILGRMESVPLRVVVTPQIPVDQVRYQVYVEGRKVEASSED